MVRFAYYRISTLDQSIDSQRDALRKEFELDSKFTMEYSDEGVSGKTAARERSGFIQMLKAIEHERRLRPDDSISVYAYAVDRFGRDAIDVQQTIKDLRGMGVTVYIRGLGSIGEGVGDLIVAVLSQVAQMERDRIISRTQAGRTLARASLEATGKTHRGKNSLGAPRKATPEVIQKLKEMHAAGATIEEIKAATGLSKPSQYRYLKLGGSKA